MHFGYFLNQNNIGLTKPFHEVVEEGREIASYCDRNGWHSIWTTEHHFGHEGLEVCPNPILMTADLAARTEQIRVGQAASIITFHHPIRLAEDLAMLDHMSAGRLEVGVGRGIYPREAVNMNPASDVRNSELNRSLFAETLEVMRRCWTEEFFSFEGEHFTFPQPGLTFEHSMSPATGANTDVETGEITALAVVPRPLQKPHPPLWQVIDTPPSIQFAAKNDLQGMFWIPPTDAMVPRFEMYRDAASEARGEELEMGDGVALVRDLFVTETMEEAERLGGQGILTYLEWVCHFRGLGNHMFPGEVLPHGGGKLDHLSYEWLHPRNLLFGSPEYVAEQIQEMRDKLNLKTLLLWSSFPGVPHEAVMDSITMFTEQVMPLFPEEQLRSEMV